MTVRVDGGERMVRVVVEVGQLEKVVVIGRITVVVGQRALQIRPLLHLLGE